MVKLIRYIQSVNAQYIGSAAYHAHVITQVSGSTQAMQGIKRQGCNLQVIAHATTYPCKTKVISGGSRTSKREDPH